MSGPCVVVEREADVTYPHWRLGLHTISIALEVLGVHTPALLLVNLVARYVIGSAKRCGLYTFYAVDEEVGSKRYMTHGSVRR